MWDWGGLIAKDVNVSKLYGDSEFAGIVESKMRDLICCTDFLERDSAGNGGGNLILGHLLSSSATAQQTERMILELNEKFRRISRKTLAESCNRVMADKDLTLWTPIIRYLHGPAFTMAKFAGNVMRMLLGYQRFVKIWDCMLCWAHFQKNIVCTVHVSVQHDNRIGQDRSG